MKKVSFALAMLVLCQTVFAKLSTKQQQNTNPIADTVFCNGIPATIDLQSLFPYASSITWSNSNGDIGLGFNGVNNLAFTTRNLTAQAIFSRITVSVVQNGIALALFEFQITVLPAFVLNPLSSKVVCNQTYMPQVNIQSNATAVVQYTWTCDQPNIGIETNGSGYIPAFYASNNYSDPILATITVGGAYASFGASCTFAPRSFSILVNPSVAIDSIPTKIFCHQQTCDSFGFNSITNGLVKYRWTNNKPQIGLPASGRNKIPLFTAANNSNQPDTALVTVIPTLVNGVSHLEVTPPGQISTFANFVRGYFFSAPKDFVITTLMVPTTASNGTQNIAVIRLNNGRPPLFSSNQTANDFTILYLTQRNNTAGRIAVNIPIRAGELIGIMGNRNDINSYASANSANISIDGQTIPVFRMGMQFSLSTTAPKNIWHEAYGGISRINFEYATNKECDGPAKTFKVVVNPKISVTPLPDASFCNQVTAQVNFPATPGLNYRWTNNNASFGLPVSGTGNIHFITANHSSAIDSATITVTPYFSNGAMACDGNSFTFKIYVQPTVGVKAIANINSCIGSTVPELIFESTTSAVQTTFLWTNDNTTIGLLASGQGNLPSFVTLNTNAQVATANLTVIPTHHVAGLSCPGTPATFSINVLPKIKIPNSGAYEFCHGSNVDINPLEGLPANNYSGVWENSNTEIGLASQGLGAIRFAATNLSNAINEGLISYTPSYTHNGLTCEGTKSQYSIVVYPQARVNAISDIEVCTEATVPVILFGSNLPRNDVYFVWQNSNTSVGLGATGLDSLPSFVAVNHSNAPAQSTVTVVPTYIGYGELSCPGEPRLFKIVVNNKPSLTFASDKETTCLTNNTFTFTNTSSGTSVLNWSFGDSTFSKIAQPQKQYNTDGTFEVTMTATSSKGCINSTSKKVVVHPQPAKPGVETILHQGLRSSLEASAYKWYLNNMLQQGEISRSLLPTDKRKAGYYQVENTNYLGCSTKSDSLYYIPEQNQSGSLDNQYVYVYPKPANGGAINVFFNMATQRKINFKLYSSLGQQVAAGTIAIGARKHIIYTGSLSAGKYILNLHDGAEVTTIKVPVSN